MRLLYRAFLLIFTLSIQSCYYWIRVQSESYSLTPRTTIKDDGKSLAKSGDIQSYPPVTSPIIKFDNGVQIAMDINVDKEGSSDAVDLHGNRLIIPFFMTSLREGIYLDAANVKMIDYQGQEKKVWLNLDYEVIDYYKDGKTLKLISPNDLSYKYYHKPILKIPSREKLMKRSDLWYVTTTTKIIFGNLVVKDTFIDGEKGFFKIIFPFMEQGKKTRYTLYYYPVWLEGLPH